jgi:CysZ protein
MIIQFSSGATFALRGFKLLNRPGIRRFVVIPLLINLVLFAGVIGYGVTQFEAFFEWLHSFLPTWLEWLRWLLWPIFTLTAALLVFFLFTPIANLIGAPFNAMLAEKLELQLTGQSPEEGKGLKDLASEVYLSLRNELKKLAYLLVWTIPLLILFVIPGINLLAPFVWFVFSAWMLALEYADYPMGNHSLAFQEERRLLKKNLSLTLGFGSAVTLITTIPVLNFLVMPVAVAGATAMWVSKLKPSAAPRESGTLPSSGKNGMFNADAENHQTVQKGFKTGGEAGEEYR